MFDPCRKLNPERLNLFGKWETHRLFVPYRNLQGWAYESLSRSGHRMKRFVDVVHRRSTVPTNTRHRWWRDNYLLRSFKWIPVVNIQYWVGGWRLGLWFMSPRIFVILWLPIVLQYVNLHSGKTNTVSTMGISYSSKFGVMGQRSEVKGPMSRGWISEDTPLVSCLDEIFYWSLLGDR